MAANFDYGSGTAFYNAMGDRRRAGECGGINTMNATGVSIDSEMSPSARTYPQDEFR